MLEIGKTGFGHQIVLGLGGGRKGQVDARLVAQLERDARVLGRVRCGECNHVFYGNLPLVNAMFLGVKAAVIVIVVEALLRVSRKALVGAGDWLVAALAFVAIFFLALPFPLIILFAALYGFLRTSAREPARETVLLRVSPFASLRTALTWGLIWALPMLLLLLVENRDRMVSKDEIIEKIWDGGIVSDSALASRVKSLRQALGDLARVDAVRPRHGPPRARAAPHRRRRA